MEVPVLVREARILLAGYGALLAWARTEPRFRPFKTEAEIQDGTGAFEGLTVCAIHSKPLHWSTLRSSRISQSSSS